MRMTDGREGAEHRDREAGRIPGKLRIAEPPDIEHHVIGRGNRRRIAGDDEQRPARQRDEGGVAKGERDIGEHRLVQIGRASCRERVCQYVSISVVAVSLKKTQNTNIYYNKPTL